MDSTAGTEHSHCHQNAKIVFFGEDSFSDIVLNSLIKHYKVKLIVTPHYENNIYKRLELTARKNNIEFIRSKDVNSPEIVTAVEQQQPDLLVVAHFEKLLKESLIGIPKFGCVNLHPSLLPKYRGMSPQHWPIINGESKTGITIHYIDIGIDTGNIILQQEITLTDDMYVSDLQKIWREYYKTIMVEAVDRVLVGNKGFQQPESEESYYGKLKDSMCRIDVDGSIESALRLIRGVSLPYQGAYIETPNGRLIIYKAEIAHAEKGKAASEAVDMHDKENRYISFKDGVLKVLMCKFVER